MMKKNAVNNLFYLEAIFCKPIQSTHFCRNTIISNVFMKSVMTSFLLFALFFINTTAAQSTTYQAENGSFFNGAKIQNCSACSEGKQVGDIGGSAQGYFTSLANVTTAGTYTMNLSFSSGDPRSIFISVNNGAAVEVVCNSGNWGVVATKNVSLVLSAGNNTIKFFNDNGFGPNIDKFDLAPEQAPVPCPSCVVVEAEAMSLFNGAAIQNCGSCSGGKQVGDIGGSANGFISTVVNAITAGNYTLDLSFSSGDPRSIFISINDGVAREILCNSGNWSVVGLESLPVVLNAGNNTIRFFNANGFGPNIDKFELKPEQIAANSFSFGKTGKLVYNTNFGTATIIVNNRQIIIEGFAEFSEGSKLISSKDYSTRIVTKSTITDGFGTGEKIVLVDYKYSKNKEEQKCP